MENTIELRAWIEKDQKMFYQDDQYLESFLRRANLLSNEQSGHPKYGRSIYMMWTTLQDKLKKKIFTGDRITWNNEEFVVKVGQFRDEDHCMELIGVHMVDKEGKCYSLGPEDQNLVEVVGNIYEKQ